MQIGFIGLGQMGSKMAANLLKRIPSLACYDSSPNSSIEKAALCSDLSEIRDKCDLIILMLPNDEAVKDVAKGLCGGRVKKIVDCSTINPNLSKKLHNLLLKKGIDYLDAPVSGGVAAAGDGSLTFMLGTENISKEGVGKIFEAMGKKTIACGARGMGHLAKVANNLILGATMITVSEAFDIAIKGGLTSKSFNDVVKNSSGRSWVTEKYLPLHGLLPKQVPADQNYNPGFSVSLMAKDLKIAKSLSKKRHHMTKLSQKIYEQLNSEYPTKDFSVIYEAISSDGKPGAK